MQQRSDNIDENSVLAPVAITLCCLLITGLYAYARYVYFGPVVESKIPLYISNKAISWSSVVVLSSSFAIGPLVTFSSRFEPWLRYRRPLGLIGLWLATLHILVSIPIFNLFYYTGFFNLDGTLKMTTELSMLAGALAWMVLLIPAVASVPSVAESLAGRSWRQLQHLGLLALVITFGHVAWLVWHGWFVSADWFGGMPPITLLSCGIIAVLMLLRLCARLAGKGKQ